MTGLCITGYVNRSVENFAKLIEGSGAAPARKNLHNDSMSELTQAAFAALTEQQRKSLKQVALNSTLKKTADNILLNQKDQELWFWADKLNISFLNAWLRLDSSIYFIHVYTSPHLVILEAIKNGNRDTSTWDNLLDEWCNYTKAILRFDLNNKKRSIIVTDDQLYAGILAVAKEWKLPLSLKAIEEQGSITISALDLYLLRMYVSQNEKIAGIEEEVRQSIARTHHLTMQPSELDISEILIRYFEKSNSITEFCQKGTAGLIPTSDNSVEAESIREPESYIYSEQDIDLQLENEKLLFQLHQSQESHENYILRYTASRKKLMSQSKKIKKILESLTGYWDIESIDVSDTDSSGATQIWKIKGLYDSEDVSTNIELESCTQSGITAITLKRIASGVKLPNWLKWPDEYASAERLPCIPSTGNAYEGTNAVLSSLSTSDWKKLRALIKHMIQALDATTDERYKVKTDRKTLKKGLERLCQVLNNWPTIVRYDGITLNDNLTSETYERLSLTLRNLCIGEHIWPLIDYRFSSVNPSKIFGENPRLEFLESTSAAFENWSVESDETLGRRLELRFAQPNAMDTEVWSVLSDRDRIMVSGIIGSLERQLATLRKESFSTSSSWAKWHALAETIKGILIINTRYPKDAAET